MHGDSRTANGTVELKPATGAFTYTPTQAARFAADMTMGADFDIFTVNVSDDVRPTPVTVKVAVLPARILNPTTSAQTGLTPMGVAVSSTKSYVANQGSNTVSVIDRANLAGTPVTINVVSAPRAIALSPDGTRAYVAGNGGVSVIDTATNQVIATVVTSAGDSYGIAVVQTGPNTQRGRDQCREQHGAGDQCRHRDQHLHRGRLGAGGVGPERNSGVR